MVKRNEQRIITTYEWVVQSFQRYINYAGGNQHVNLVHNFAYALNFISWIVIYITRIPIKVKKVSKEGNQWKTKRKPILVRNRLEEIF